MLSIGEKYNEFKGKLIEKNINGIKELLQDSHAIDLLQHIDEEQMTLLFHTCAIEDENFALLVLKMLLEKGADLYHQDKYHENIIFHLARDGKHELHIVGKTLLLEYLLQYNYNLNKNDFIKQTAIFYASRNNQLKTIQMLLRKGCDVNHLDDHHQTCLYYAARQGHLEMCKLLIKYGCKYAHQDKNRTKALFYAKKNGHKQVVQYLKSLKNETKVIKQNNKIQDHQIEKKKIKKEIIKNEYCLIYTNDEGKVHKLTSQQLLQFKNINYTYDKLYSFMTNPDKLQGQTLPMDRKYEKTVLKILNYFWKQEYAYHFHQPVDTHRYPQYLKFVKHPMDLGSIRRKINYAAYDNQEDFFNDMNLMFDNCILFNGNQSAFGKIAQEMKLQFNTMYVKQFYST